MIAILTKRIPCTNHRPTRIKAYTANGHYCYMTYEGPESHLDAIRKLATQYLQWNDQDTGGLIVGDTKEGKVAVGANDERIEL